MVKHLVACSVFGLGAALSTWLVIPCALYLGYYQYYLFGRMAQMKLGYNVPYT